MSDSDSNSGGEGSSTGIRKKAKYFQNYKKDWENIPEFKGWLTNSLKGSSYARCKPCDKDINITSGKDALIKHKARQFHIKRIKCIAKQPSITSFIGTEGVSKITLDRSVKEGKRCLKYII